MVFFVFLQNNKGSFKIYPIPEDADNVQQNLFFSNIKQVVKEECLVRVYIVRGIDLQPKDSNGKVKKYFERENYLGFFLFWINFYYKQV